MADFAAVLLFLQIAHLLIEVLLDGQRLFQSRFVFVTAPGSFQLQIEAIRLGLDVELDRGVKRRQLGRIFAGLFDLIERIQF